MKRALLTALIVSASIAGALAQDQKQYVSTNASAAKESDQRAAEMKKAAQEWQQLLVTELKLSEEQIRKIDEMNKMFGERRQSIANNAELAGEEKRERIMKLGKAKEAQFAQLLSQEQQARYKELVEARKKDAPRKEN